MAKKFSLIASAEVSEFFTLPVKEGEVFTINGGKEIDGFLYFETSKGEIPVWKLAGGKATFCKFEQQTQEVVKLLKDANIKDGFFGKQVLNLSDKDLSDEIETAVTNKSSINVKIDKIFNIECWNKKGDGHYTRPFCKLVKA